MTEPTGTAARTLPTASIAPRRSTGLRTIYAGSFAAFVGLAIADVVYPLLVLGFTGKPVLAGLFGAVQFTALVLASVPVGGFVDRHDRRRVLIAGESLRAALATVLAISLAAGHIWLVEIYLIAAVLGVCQPLSGVRTLALRAVAPKEQLTKALSMQQAVSAVAELIGPAIGTALFAFDRALPFAATALGTGISALCAYLVRFDGRPQPAAAAADHAGDETSDASAAAAEGRFAGLGIIWRHPVMRGTMLFIMLFNLVAVPLTLVMIMQLRSEAVPTHFIGLILAASSVGGLLGAPAVPALHARLRPGMLLTGLGLVATTSCAAIALPFGGFWLAGWLAAIGFTIPAASVLVDVLILQQVPDHQRGRVLSAVMTFMGLGMPLGAAFGGSMLQVFSPATVLLGIAGALGLVTLCAFAQRELRRAVWPAALDTEDTGETAETAPSDESAEAAGVAAFAAG